MDPSASIDRREGTLLTVTEAAAVRDLAAAAGSADGVAPLSEQTFLNLRAGAPDVVHLLANRDDAVVGYAQVDLGSGPSAELVVHPGHRRRGLGTRLLAAATAAAAESSAGGVRVWAHGNLPAARALAARAGLAVVRELYFLGRPIAAADRRPPAVPAGLRLRTFVLGVDDDAWVDLNARAFADHPEQGRLTVADLRARAAEEWFDAGGFFLLERAVPRPAARSDEPADAALLGYLWTKVTARDTAAPVTGAAPETTIPTAAAPGRQGEIYAVGVDPSAHGAGLGRLLTAVGLAHLAEAGVDRAVLYVDGDNTAARALYERAGFAPLAVDVQYATAPTAAGDSE